MRFRRLWIIWPALLACSLPLFGQDSLSVKGALDIRQVWMDHTRDAINGEPLDYYHSKNPE